MPLGLNFKRRYVGMFYDGGLEAIVLIILLESCPLDSLAILIDHMLCPVLEGQLFLQARWPPRDPAADVVVRVLLVVLLAILASLWRTTA